MGNERLKKVYTVASRYFNQKRYTNTKMAEIAKESEVAVGTLYSMFTGKEALLSFTILCGLDRERLSHEFSMPIPTVDTAVLQRHLRMVLDHIKEAVGITDEQGNIRKDFMSCAGDIYDIFTDYLLVLDNIEKNRQVLEELSQTYLSEKRWFFEELARYLRLYAEAGQICPISHPEIHVEFLISTFSWWSTNIWLSFPNTDLTRGEAREICMSIIRRAYCP